MPRKRKEGSLSQNSHFLLGFGIAKVRRKKSESVEIDPSTVSTSSVHQCTSRCLVLRTDGSSTTSTTGLSSDRSLLASDLKRMTVKAAWINVPKKQAVCKIVSNKESSTTSQSCRRS